jgi:predicted kinase
MLDIRPNCECCNRDLPNESEAARICTFECTFCDGCSAALKNVCPNCGGELLGRPRRPAAALARNPASAVRVFKPAGCADAATAIRPSQSPGVADSTSHDNTKPNQASLHFLCGKAGAGKSTLATALAKTHGAVLISEDIWLARLFGDQMKTFEDYRSCAQRAKTVLGPLVIDLLAARQSVVLDLPANTRLSRAWIRSLYEAAGTDHVLHYIDVPDRTCLRRIEKRNCERPEGSHHLTEADFVYISSLFEQPEVDEGFHIEAHTAADL